MDQGVISYPSLLRPGMDVARNKSFTHIEHRVGTVCPESLVNKIPVLTPEYLLPSQWVPVIFLLLIYFPYGPDSFSHYTKVWHRTYPICDAPLSKLSRRRNRAEIRVFMCKQKPYLVWFSCRRKSYWLKWNIALDGLPFVGVVVEGLHDGSKSSSSGEHPDVGSGMHLRSADCSKKFLVAAIPTPLGSDIILKSFLGRINALSITLICSKWNCLRNPLKNKGLAFANTSLSEGPPP